ncbi:plastocyanin-like domain-containing protein [Sodiomyces alkalinus F11]|uniref:Plastocyanin-like domain-containing protein n=1 Tax=Sodiomyces alkalinus (strain CBS 110278 / VKM F-3762 / F11) TaxID=1314773 RepID=A0A3N2PKT0_SODAK|nr:plastocyanin-like domain-containing protein [Sodiomyces alkalinus F11]ROT35138.1 plastocyanin-like domain-containing protein [Sodiomyces alkalinus F11]
MLAKSIVLLSAFAGLIAAMPTPTEHTGPSGTVPLTGVTHTVVAGRGGLRFDPDNVVAEVGDVVEWHFLPRNHAVAQSSFANPCTPLANSTGFYSGFNFAVQEGQAENVFQVVVEDGRPTWYYCPQLNGAHCQNGMVGVINQNFDSPDFDLRAHRRLAALTGVSVIPAIQQGGEVVENPNPLSGF